MREGKWGLAPVVGIIAVAAADESHVIWRSSGFDGFEWWPGWRTYASKDGCEQALDVLMHAVGDRVYQCRPAAPAFPKALTRITLTRGEGASCRRR